MISSLVAQKVLGMEAYQVDESPCQVKLDANENPYDTPESIKTEIMEQLVITMLNRYPDSDCTEIRRLLSDYSGIHEDCIIVGNGSDELIHICLQAFVDPGDAVVIHTPTFSMYKAYTKMCSGHLIECQTDDKFNVDVEKMIKTASDVNAKVMILCSPNNPTGNTIPLIDIGKVLEQFKGIVLVDEAYYEFSGETAVGLLKQHDNLIILRTLSKAMGMAGLRIGYLMCSNEAAEYINRVKSPYNVNSLSQAVARVVLEKHSFLEARVENIITEREKMYEYVMQFKDVECSPTKSNFILMKTKNCEAIYKVLREKGIKVKNFGEGRLKDYLRITIGRPEENERVMEVMEVMCRELGGLQTDPNEQGNNRDQD